MGETEKSSVLKKMLKSLCVSNGWSYGVLWRFDQRNSMLLTMEDAYYEEQVKAVIDSMLLQVHILGEGIVGQTAFNGKHQWMCSDDSDGEWNSFRSIASQDVFQGDPEFHCQFSSGIKTIAVIPVEPYGVVEFGSTEKILERSEILDQTKRLFQDMQNPDVLIPSENVHSSEKSESYDLNGLFASLISGNLNSEDVTPVSIDNSKEPSENNFTAMKFSQFSPCISDIHNGSMPFSHTDASNVDGHLQNAGMGSHILLSDKPSTRFDQVFQRSTTPVKNDFADKAPCISALSCEHSVLTSINPQFASESRGQGSADAVLSRGNSLESCRNKGHNIQSNPTFASLYGAGELTDLEKHFNGNSGNLMDNQQPMSSIYAAGGEIPEKESSLHRFPKELAEEFKPTDLTTDLFNFYLTDDLSQLFTSLPDQSINAMAKALSDDFSQLIETTSASCSLVGGDVFADVPIEHPANFVHGSIANTFNAGGQEKSGIVQCVERDLFDSLRPGIGCGQVGKCWEDTMMPISSGGNSSSSTLSKCISELDARSMSSSKKGLFSELELEKLLAAASTSCSATNSNLEDQSSSTKRRRIESSTLNCNEAQLARFTGSSGSISSMNYNLDKLNNLVAKKEVIPKSQVGLWIDDSYSITAGSAVLSKTQKPEEQTKTTRKRARPGESTRPRPKDRQQIQDRIKELRGIIPNGGKCSIDSLLDRTIKYMLFLQSVTKNADKLKQADEPKLISQENGVVLKDQGTACGSGGGGGVTWAFEVGGQTMVCPIIVEDLNPPGQMLIEMLCEEQGFFLEIADIIRGFGLNILKGRMEVRENKIWARFIVEANRHVTRIDIFWSLVRLLQQTTTSGIDSTNNQPSNAIDGGLHLMDSYQKPALPPPISLTGTLR
ncbi:transcription factor bHLH157 [Ziziphus jujuba]|uniref:Transcription factor bHLH157 n=1 Tax=Ziziphus jujuba TaxID=326968 RepID=A0A6P4AK42_ZIZJJ|nr:transcription factor bHLH157 [Ziziphus jujuba]